MLSNILFVSHSKSDKLTFNVISVRRLLNSQYHRWPQGQCGLKFVLNVLYRLFDRHFVFKIRLKITNSEGPQNISFKSYCST